MRELDRLKCIQGLIDKQLRQKAVAERLGLTVRQVRRLAHRYAVAGPVGLLSKRFNRPSYNRVDDASGDQVIKILRSTWPRRPCGDFRLPSGPPKIQQPRLRRACLGEFIQIDGSKHHWFEDRGPYCTILAYVDDATSRLQLLRFVEGESTFDYMQAAKLYIERYGIPVAFYSDRSLGQNLEYREFDKLTHIHQGEVVPHKRSGAMLELTSHNQKQFPDEKRSPKCPTRLYPAPASLT